jgi:hypothetical protein
MEMDRFSFRRFYLETSFFTSQTCQSPHYSFDSMEKKEKEKAKAKTGERKQRGKMIKGK